MGQEVIVQKVKKFPPSRCSVLNLKQTDKCMLTKISAHLHLKAASKYYRGTITYTIFFFLGGGSMDIYFSLSTSLSKNKNNRTCNKNVIKFIYTILFDSKKRKWLP